MSWDDLIAPMAPQPAAEQAVWPRQAEDKQQLHDRFVRDYLPAAPANASIPAEIAAMTRDKRLQLWEAAAQRLDEAKVREMELRIAIFKLEFPNAKEGTNTVELGNGYELKGVRKISYDLDKDTNKVELALKSVANVDAEGAFLAERLVSWKPLLSVKEYKLLGNGAYKTAIDMVLTTKDGAPTLEVKPVKPPKV